MSRLIIYVIFTTVLATAAFAGGVSISIQKAEVICSATTSGPPAPVYIEVTIDRSIRYLYESNRSQIADLKAREKRRIEELDKVNATVQQKDNDPELFNIRAELKKLNAVISWLTGTFQEKANYFLLDLDLGVKYDVEISSVDTELQNTIRMSIPNFAMPSNLMLVAKTTTSDSDTPVMVTVSKHISCSVSDGKVPAPDGPASPKKPDDTTLLNLVRESKTDPVINIDAAFSGTKGKRSLVDISVGFTPFTFRRFATRSYWEISPFAFTTEYRFNSTEGNRKNTFNIGSEFTFYRFLHSRGNQFGRDSAPRYTFPAIVTHFSGTVKSKWGWKEASAVGRLDFTLPINLFQTRATTIRLDPFIGFEGGVYLRSKVEKPGRPLLRPLFGAKLTAGFLRSGDSQAILFTADYTRMFPLKPELSGSYDDSGTYVKDRRSTRPRDHVTAGIIFNLGRIKPFIEYEYGRIWPEYSLINSRFKTGFKVSGDLWWKRFR